MYRTLFELAGPAMLAWATLIFFPKWRVTRRLAESAIMPAYLAGLYVAGLWFALHETGPGIMREFGSADGVLRILRMESVALVAWIHILAFDQVVALLIYRDNMRHRYVPVWLQSAILLATLMFGPVGFAAYWLARVTRRRAALAAWGERDDTPWVEPAGPSRLADFTPAQSVSGAVRDLVAQHPPLVMLAGTGFALAAMCTVIAGLNGSWLLGAEGRLLEAAKFDVAVGIFVLTEALLLPLTGFSAARRRRWVWAMVGLVLFGFAVENVQAWRGLDPRFSRVAGGADRALGAIFFVSALMIMWYFIDLASAFWRRDALADVPALRDALRYAGVVTMFGFVAGIVMSAINSRYVGAAGNVMPIHAAGFHALQAIPVVGLLAGWSALDGAAARRLVQGAGTGWLLLCAGLAADAALGRPPLSGGIGTGLVAGGTFVWAASVAIAFRAYRAARAGVAVETLPS